MEILSKMGLFDQVEEVFEEVYYDYQRLQV